MCGSMLSKPSKRGLLTKERVGTSTSIRLHASGTNQPSSIDVNPPQGVVNVQRLSSIRYSPGESCRVSARELDQFHSFHFPTTSDHPNGPTIVIYQVAIQDEQHGGTGNNMEK